VKKIATILLLALLLFNFIGYRFLFYALQEAAETNIVAKIDTQNYNDADLITLTVPLSMPYLTDSKDFERKDGEITINGKIYHYVKQKITQGNLVLMCLPDEQKTHLQNAKNDFFKNQTDFQNNTSKRSGDNSQVIKLVISDYEQLQTASLDFYSTGASQSFNCYAIFATQKGKGVMPEQPPEA
jgi:hypothetical protein